MANKEQVKRLKRSVEEWNVWRQEYPEVFPDLSRADLYEANLSGADFSYTDLSNADLTSANLSHANLNYVDLSNTRLNKANLSHADLSHASSVWANFYDADLTGVDLTSANLSAAIFNGTNLNGTILMEVLFSSTTFAQIDLSHVEGLETARYNGPSIVDINSVILPTDESTRLHFLRGVGFTETQIEYLPSLLTPQPVQYCSLFISYAHRDETLAKRLHIDLRKNDVPCWFAPEDLKIGDRFHARINEAIHMQDKVLLLLSEHALASDWVEIEVRAALEKEQRQHRDVLFPIRLDNSLIETTQAWAAMLRQSRHIGDFTRWKNHDEYQKAFQRLLNDLKAETTRESD